MMSGCWAKILLAITLIITALEHLESSAIPIATNTNLTNLLPQPDPSKPNHYLMANPLPFDARLIDIHSVNPNIILDIRYATENNFLQRKLYPVARCVLRGGAARRLSEVQEYLETKGLGLKVFDCYRPLSVQKQMWQVKPDSRYVANPARGSRHNRGAAVDLTLVDSNGNELEMPTDFDDFTEKAHRNYQGGSAEARKNSQILEEAMERSGFISLATEWWHFDAPNWQNYAILDVKFGEIP
ncbi:MAG: M15 family metallopeptidase [Coleofasciculaceae cyanobacterium]